MESKPVHDATTRCTGTSIKGERFLEKKPSGKEIKIRQEISPEMIKNIILRIEEL